MYPIRVVSLLPELVEPVTRSGVVGRACERGLIDVRHVSPRNFVSDAHRTVDDRPYGGGPGMVLKYEPLRDAVRSARDELPAGSRAFLLSAQGRVLDQALVEEIASGPGLLLVAGRYEGVDERILEHEDLEELSLGDYVLSGGELAAAVVIDAVGRQLPDVLGHEDSARQDSYATGLLDYPQYTRPESVDGLDVPKVLLAGNHEAIRRWRLKQALGRTWQRRPELLRTRALTAEERGLLEEFIAEHGVAPGPGESVSD
ncbi:MAG: tRNA (guanosine(37)-N1)-methyltransferase TrmD [Gammaproteobacteria bacterium]|nr:tRNA (guanosine(37)-N1)-methyltransferase TrmD [Gammaproteobacteria bacterium]